MKKVTLALDNLSDFSIVTLHINYIINPVYVCSWLTSLENLSTSLTVIIFDSSFVTDHFLILYSICQLSNNKTERTAPSIVHCHSDTICWDTHSQAYFDCLAVFYCFRVGWFSNILQSARSSSNTGFTNLSALNKKCKLILNVK